jgi:hypothetical protein
MRSIYIAASLALSLSGAATAETVTPDWILANTELVHVADCTDQESGERGTCFLSQDATNIYMTFVQDAEPVFIRRTMPMGYEQVWPEQQPGGNEL